MGETRFEGSGRGCPMKKDKRCRDQRELEEKSSPELLFDLWYRLALVILVGMTVVGISVLVVLLVLGLKGLR